VIAVSPFTLFQSPYFATGCEGGAGIVLAMKRKERLMKRQSILSVVVLLLMLAAVFGVYRGLGMSQTTPPSAPTVQQPEMTELKQQLAALEQRVKTIEEQLADLSQYKMRPLQPR
jgi:cell division protein FtsB